MVGSLQTVVVHTLIPVLRGRGRQISSSEATLVYRVSSRTVRAIQRDPVSEKQKQQTKPNQTKKQKPPKQTKQNKKPQQWKTGSIVYGQQW